jgi:acetolactate synthase-1/2/3 large subunit
MEYAFHLTSQNKQVHINIPKDILNKVESHKWESHTCKSLEINNLMPPISYNLLEIADIINISKKPILYVGRGCNEAYEEVRNLAKIGDIPITTTLHGLGIFDENDNLSLKMVGMHGSQRANIAIQNADCIICIGARFDDRTVGSIEKYAPHAKYIIHINNDITSFNKVINKSINIHGDAKEILFELNNYIDSKFNIYWNNYLKTIPIDFPYTVDTLNQLKQQDVLLLFNNELDKLDIKKDIIITTGVGNHQMYAAQLITHKYPNRFITSGSLGTMGSSNSMAIGCKIANPDKIVFSIDGDQSFNMMNDLNMILNYNIPIKIMIMYDSKQSMVNIWEKLFFNNNIVATERINPNYKLIAEAYNINYLELHNNLSEKSMRNIIKQFILDDKPVLLNCIVGSDFCLPLVPPGKGLDEMITYKNINNYIIDKNIIPS